MITIIILYLFGIVGVVGCFCGATHHAMTAAVSLILATRFLQDRIEGRMSKEIDTLAFENNALKSDLEESKKHEATARKLYEEEKTKVTAKNIEIRTLEEQLADLPKRGKDGKFVKNND